MSTEANLSIWVAASVGDAMATKTLNNHFFSGSYLLKATDLDFIFGAAS